MLPRKNTSSVICGSSGLSSETEYIDKLNEGATPSYIHRCASLSIYMARQARENSIGIV